MLGLETQCVLQGLPAGRGDRRAVQCVVTEGSQGCEHPEEGTGKPAGGQTCQSCSALRVQGAGLYLLPFQQVSKADSPTCLVPPQLPHPSPCLAFLSVAFCPAGVLLQPGHPRLSQLCDH